MSNPTCTCCGEANWPSVDLRVIAYTDDLTGEDRAGRFCPDCCTGCPVCGAPVDGDGCTLEMGHDYDNAEVDATVTTADAPVVASVRIPAATLPTTRATRAALVGSLAAYRTHSEGTLVGFIERIEGLSAVVRFADGRWAMTGRDVDLCADRQCAACRYFTGHTSWCPNR